jgi:hypothetical protein
MYKNGVKVWLIRARACCEVPEIGVQGQVTCGANESDQFFSGFFKNADLPEAAL